MTDKLIVRCVHCGNKTPMELLNKYEYVKTLTRPKLSDKIKAEEMQIHNLFSLFECPVCNLIQMINTSWERGEEAREGFNRYEVNSKVLYPFTERVFDLMLPENISKAYASARKVKDSDNIICLMALRRTLEMVCKDNGATKGQLHHKLNELKQREVLPPLIGDISTLIKDVGNMAAHGDDVEFDNLLASNMFSLTNRILEYVYILPHDIERTRSEMEKITKKSLAEPSSGGSL